jgi:hypothetical protein
MVAGPWLGNCNATLSGLTWPGKSNPDTGVKPGTELIQPKAAVPVSTAKAQWPSLPSECQPPAIHQPLASPVIRGLSLMHRRPNH